MSIEEANKILENGGTLTPEQKSEFVRNILNNPEAYQTTIYGALKNNDFALAFSLMKKDTPNHWFEKGQGINHHTDIRSDGF